MKYLKKYESYSNKIISGLSEDDLYTIEQILLPYCDVKKCEFAHKDHFIYAKMVDAESANELKETLDRWGFKYSYDEPSKATTNKWYIFGFWGDKLVKRFLELFDKASMASLVKFRIMINMISSEFGLDDTEMKLFIDYMTI